jgi:hypothetical protein
VPADDPATRHAIVTAGKELGTVVLKVTLEGNCIDGQTPAYAEFTQALDLCKPEDDEQADCSGCSERPGSLGSADVYNSQGPTARWWLGPNNDRSHGGYLLLQTRTP